MTAFRNLTLAGVLGLGLLAGGCSAFDNDNDHHSSRSSDRYDDRYDSGRVSRSGGDVERASGTSRSLPRDARMVDEVRGGRMNYTARDSGEISLYDATARTVVWDGRVRDGDRVTVNPDKNRIEINGKEQADIDLKSNHRFELYSTDRSRRY
jgi:hypothetical protein